MDAPTGQRRRVDVRVEPFVDDADFTLYVGDAVECLAAIADDTVDCVVTSPPYYALRDYGTGRWEGGDPDCDHKPRQAWIGDAGDLPYGGPNGLRANEAKAERRRRGVCHCGARRVDEQIGSEPTVTEYVERLVDVFAEVRRVLKPTGTVWLNLGDSFASKQNSGTGWDSSTLTRPEGRPRKIQQAQEASKNTRRDRFDLPQKNLLMIPARVAMALQADGWWVRQCVIWDKPNPLPESATDRPSTSHEYVYMLTKADRYFYDHEAVKEPAKWERWGNQTSRKNGQRHDQQHVRGGHIRKLSPEQVQEEFGQMRNLRSVWTIPTTPNGLAVCEECESFFHNSADADQHRERTGHEVTQHFAAFPRKLVEKCLTAGCPTEVCSDCGTPRERVYVNSEPVGWQDCGCGAGFTPATVMDPFLGSGTTTLVTRATGRRCIGIELRPAFARMSAWRLSQLSLLTEAHA